MLCRQGRLERRGTSKARAASGWITDFGLFFLLTGWLLGWGDFASGSSSFMVLGGGCAGPAHGARPAGAISRAPGAHYLRRLLNVRNS